MADFKWIGEEEVEREQQAIKEKERKSQELEAAIPAMLTAVRKLVKVSDLSPQELSSIIDLYPTWTDLKTYAEDELVKHNGLLYRAIQPHPGQADRQPHLTPALFTPINPPGMIGTWRQPTMAEDAYNTGAQVEYNDKIWTSKINGNTTIPGEDTLNRWWETDVVVPPIEESTVPTVQSWLAWDNIRPLYQIGSKVTHKGKTWESTAANNHWEPGVYGWK